MAEAYCPTCKRTFSAAQYFYQHLDYANNVACLLEHRPWLRAGGPGCRGPGKRVASTVIGGQYSVNIAKKPRHEVPETPNTENAVAAEEDFGFGTHESSPTVAEIPRNVGRIVEDPFEFLKEEELIEAPPPDSDAVAPDAAGPKSIETPREKPSEPDDTILKEFREYSTYARKNYCQLPPSMKAGIELMKILNDKGAPLAVYDEVYKWHLANLDAECSVERNELMKKLRERYNMEKTMPFEVKTTLPGSKACLKVTCHDAYAQITDLLTDPRIKDEDYLFFGDDPTKGPPEEFEWLSDINTGLAYRKTWDKLIKPEPLTESGRVKILCPTIFYVDGCQMGQYDHLPLEVLKFTLGLFNSNCREKAHAWRNLGFVRTFLPAKTEAEKMILESKHVDAKSFLKCTEIYEEDATNSEDITLDFDPSLYYLSDDADDNGETTNNERKEPSVPETKPQDLHKMLQIILSSYKELEARGGFEWDLYYKEELYKAQIIPFVLFIKGDTVEHNKHCGSYAGGSRGVKQVCRYCCCPMAETDEPYLDHEYKSPEMMTKLVKERDEDALNKLSQQMIWNCWYELCFGLHNKLGVHGACPLELLHWIQLGIYKYTRKMFFEQTGDNSKLGKAINVVAIHIGFLFQRQSDRDLPRTKFNKGVKDGVLMGHEMSGVMLVLAATLRSTKGRNLLLKEAGPLQKEFFKTKKYVKDWIMLIETELQFEAWLNQPELEVAKVERARTKVREFMEMYKVIGKRQAGMQFKTQNFHCTKHVPQDILNFGVPTNVNSKCNESHHKPDKKSAKRTQKRPNIFDYQCGRSIQHKMTIDFGMEEIASRPRWNYYRGHEDEVEYKQSTKKRSGSTLTGVRTEFWYDEVDEEWIPKVFSSMKEKHRFKYDELLVECIEDVAETCEEYLDKLVVYTELKTSDGQIYRASPFYQGKPWNDWAMMDYSNGTIDNVELKPAQFLCFIDLRDLPLQNKTPYKPGFYAIVNTTRKVNDKEEINMSDFFEPYVKETFKRPDDNDPINRMEMHPIHQVVEPTCLIPDLANKHTRFYFRVVPRSLWADLFDEWLNQDHTREFNEPQGS